MRFGSILGFLGGGGLGATLGGIGGDLFEGVVWVLEASGVGVL